VVLLVCCPKEAWTAHDNPTLPDQANGAALQRFLLTTRHCCVALTSRPSHAGNSSARGTDRRRTRLGARSLSLVRGPIRAGSDPGISGRCWPGWCIRAARGLGVMGRQCVMAWPAVDQSTPGIGISLLAQNDAPQTGRRNLVAAALDSQGKGSRTARRAARLVRAGSTPQYRPGCGWRLSGYWSQWSTTSECGTRACGRNGPTCPTPTCLLIIEYNGRQHC